MYVYTPVYMYGIIDGLWCFSQSYHRPLNPTDPNAASLTIEHSLNAHLGDESADHGDGKTKEKGSSKKSSK